MKWHTKFITISLLVNFLALHCKVQSTFFKLVKLIDFSNTLINKVKNRKSVKKLIKLASFGFELN